MKLVLNKKSFVKNYWGKKHFFLPGGIKNFNDNFVDLDDLNSLSTKALERKIFIQDGRKYINFTNVKKKLNENTPKSKLFYKILLSCLNQLFYSIKFDIKLML